MFNDLIKKKKNNSSQVTNMGSKTPKIAGDPKNLPFILTVTIIIGGTDPLTDDKKKS